MTLRPSLMLMSALCVVRRVEAHPPYEHPVGSVVDAAGGRLELVKRYTDGILFTDPSSIQIRDSTGNVLAETPGSRDTIITRLAGRYYVYEYDTPLSVFPTRAWAIDNGRLVSSPRSRYIIGGL